MEPQKRCAERFCRTARVAVAMGLASSPRLSRGPSNLAPLGRQLIQAKKPRDGARGVNRCLFDEAALHCHARADRVRVR